MRRLRLYRRCGLKIKNSSIEFYEKDKRVFVSQRDDLRKFIYKPFFISSEKPTDWLYWLAVAHSYLRHYVIFICCIFCSWFCCI